MALLLSVVTSRVLKLSTNPISNLKPRQESLINVTILSISYDTDCIGNIAPNGSSVVACVFIAAGT
jgi:hypothetical protein